MNCYSRGKSLWFAKKYPLQGWEKEVASSYNQSVSKLELYYYKMFQSSNFTEPI